MRNALPVRLRSLASAALTARQSMAPTECFMVSIAAMKGAGCSLCAIQHGTIIQTQTISWATLEVPSMNNDSPFHAQVVMKGTDVLESAWRGKRHSKPRHA